MKREEIEEKYKWDLTLYFPTPQKCREELNEVLAHVDDLSKYKGQIIENNDKAIFDCLKEDAYWAQKLENINVYAYCYYCQDTSHKDAVELFELYESISTEFLTKTNFILTDLAKLSETYLTKLQNNTQHSEFSNIFKSIIKNKKHILSEKEELLLSKLMPLTEGFATAFRAFESKDLNFEDAVDSKGNKHKISFGSYSELMLSEDETLRKSANINYNEAYKKATSVISNNYINLVKFNATYSEIKNYSSTLEAQLDTEDLTVDVYNNLKKQINQNLNIPHKINQLHARLLGEEKVSAHNSVFIPFKLDKYNINFEDATEFIKKSLSVLGKEYASALKDFLSKRTIEVYDSDNKISEEYEIAGYPNSPLIFYKYTNTLTDMLGLAHEIGHAMHTHFSFKNQPYSKAQYTIFLAEIASTVNELIIILETIKKETNTENKIALYFRLMQMIDGTIFRQMQFSEFEEQAHKQYEENKVLTEDFLHETYLNLTKKYLGEHFEYTKYTPSVWCRIPHFYYVFYVYKYVTGLLSAISIVSKLLSKPEDYNQKYINFLSSGISLTPLETLKLVDIDLTNEETFKDSFKMCQTWLHEFEVLVNEYLSSKNK